MELRLDPKAIGWSYGVHELDVNVWDNEGNRTEVTWSVTYFPPTSFQFGGADHDINEDAEYDAVGAALSGASDVFSLWGGLSLEDRYELLSGIDASFAQWAPRIDRSGPTIALDPGFGDIDFGSRNALVMWESGEDPDIDPGLGGTGVAAAQYRYKESDGEWHSWAQTDEFAFDMKDVDPNDQFDVEIREYDGAGNPSITGSFVITAPSAPVTRALPAIVAGGLLVCARWCPKGSKYVRDGLTWTVKKVPKNTVRATRHQSDHYLALWRSTRLSKSGGRAKLRRELKKKYGDEAADGKFAHHIVAHGHKVSRRAQEILAKCGVDPNGAANGVFLTREQHKRTLNPEYYENINRVIESYWHNCGEPGGGPFGKKHLTEALFDIGQDLKKGHTVFPG